MYVRLAFAVAAHLEPEILVIDEVLAVGDAEFQKHCLDRMSEVASMRPHRAVRQPQPRGRHRAHQARHRLPVRPARLRRRRSRRRSRTTRRRSRKVSERPQLGHGQHSTLISAALLDERRPADRPLRCPARRSPARRAGDGGPARHVARGRPARRAQSAGRLLFVQHVQPGVVAGRAGPLRMHA